MRLALLTESQLRLVSGSSHADAEIYSLPVANGRSDNDRGHLYDRGFGAYFPSSHALLVLIFGPGR